MEDRVRAFIKVSAQTQDKLSVLKIGHSSNSIAVPLDKENAKHASPITFTFDQCFGAGSSNQEVFSHLKSQLFDATLSGINTSVIVFGGPEDGTWAVCFGQQSNEKGIIEIFIEELLIAAPGRDFTMALSAYEIGNDHIKDVLNEDNDRRVRIAEDARGTVSIEGLSQVPLETTSDVSAIMKKVQTFGSSSSSARAVEIELITVAIDTKDRALKKLASKLTFFDISGFGISRANRSENEFATIQPPLAALRAVVDALTFANQSQSKRREASPAVPYRSTILTWVLRDALGGNARSAFVGVVSNDISDLEETRSTLAFTKKVGAVRNHPCENELPCSVLNRAVNKEIQTLWQKVAAESTLQQSASPTRKDRGRRFSMEALNCLHQATNEDEIKIYKERALAAERASRERAEVLWESFQQLQAQYAETIQHLKNTAMDEARRVLEQQYTARNELLISHASVLLIQVWWRRYQLRQAQNQLHAQVQMLETRTEALLAERDEAFSELAAATARADSTARELSTMRDQVDSKSRAIADKMAELESYLREREQEVLQLQRQLLDTSKASDSQAHELHQQVLDAQKVISNLKNTVAQLEGRLQESCRAREQLVSKQTASDARISQLEGTLRARDQVITDLSAKGNLEAKAVSNAVRAAEERLTAQLQLARTEADRSARQARDADQALQNALARLAQAEQDAEGIRKRLHEAELLNGKTQTNLSAATEKSTRQVEELQARLVEMEAAKAKAKQVQEEELNGLREQLKQTSAGELNELERANAELLEKGTAEMRASELEVKVLRAKIGSLELQLEAAKTSTQREIDQREKRIRDLERSQKDSKGRERTDLEKKSRELEVMEITVKRLQKELDATKSSTSREVLERDKKLRELEKNLTEQASSQQRAAGASFLQYRRDPRQRPEANRRLSMLSVIQPANATVLATVQQQEDLLCVRVDVESFDERSALFYANSSSVLPEDPTTRTFHVRSPLYDLKKARWSRFRIKVIHKSAQRIDEVSNVCLEHHLPGGRSVMHRLRVTKSEPAREGGLQSVTCDWDTGTNVGSNTGVALLDDQGVRFEPGHNCFCFHKMEESGPMTLHATFRFGDLPVHWEYPMRFRNKTDFIEKLPGIGPKYLSSRRAADEVKHEYLNASWFCVESDSQGPARAEPISSGSRIVAFSGYLQKHQSHRGGKVQRWFVFAPPFLLCYQDHVHASDDFSQARALPHSANRAMRIGASTKIVVSPSAVTRGDRLEFSVHGEDKSWTLQAANREDAERWTSSLSAWVAHERELHPNARDLDMGPAPVDDDEDEEDM